MFIDHERIAQDVAASLEIDPYFVGSAISELDSAGLFSSVRSWRKDATGKYVPTGGYAAPGVGYTEFTERFVSFIRDPD